MQTQLINSSPIYSFKELDRAGGEGSRGKMVRIDLVGGEIGPAVRLLVEGLGPTEVGIDSAKLGAVLEELDLEPGMDARKLRQAAQAVRIGIVKQAQRTGGVLRL